MFKQTVMGRHSVLGHNSTAMAPRVVAARDNGGSEESQLGIIPSTDHCRLLSADFPMS